MLEIFCAKMDYYISGKILVHLIVIIGKPQLLLIKETIINYLFAVPFLYCISLMVYAPKLSLK
jgi:hypothetical protein